MKAIILAAGRGSRMKNLTFDRPKCLVELHKKALLKWQVEALRAAGVTDIAIVTGYKREMLLSFNLVEYHNERWADTQMVTSLMCADEWLSAGTCIVSYSDIFYEPAAVKSLITSGAILAVTYDPNWLEQWSRRFEDPLCDAETFKLAPGDKLVEIGQKPHSTKEIQGQYMGLLRFTPSGWGEAKDVLSKLSTEQREKIHLTQLLQLIIDKDAVEISAIPYEGFWGEIDSQSDLAASEEMLLNIKNKQSSKS